MKTQRIGYEVRDTEITVVAPADLKGLVELVGEDAVLKNYIQYVAYRKVASRVAKLIEDGEEVPEEFDLTLPGEMPVFGSGTKAGKYPIPAKYLSEALVLMKVKTKLKDIDEDSEEFEKALKVGRALRDAETRAKEEQAKLLASMA